MGDKSPEGIACRLDRFLRLGPALGQGLEVGLLLVEGREVAPLQVAVGGNAGEIVAQPRLLLHDLLPLGETAKARLAILRETEDGFRIAEEDLKLRGAGELLGTRQSGLPDMRLADLAAHGELLPAAQDDARLIVDRDPELQSDRGTALRALLYLFRRDDAVRTLRAG